MAQAQLGILPSYFAKFKNGFLFVFVEEDDYKKYIVSDEVAVARHSPGFCSKEKCQYHILLNGPDLLSKLVSLTFEYQPVCCPYSYFKFYISNCEKIFLEGNLIMLPLQRAINYNRYHRHPEMKKNAEMRRKIRRRIRREHFAKLSSDVDKSTQTSNQNQFYKRLENVMQTRHALILMQIVDCMLDDLNMVENDKFTFIIK